MNKRYRVLPYRQGSRSARALADALPNGRVLRLEGSLFNPRPTDVIINWGNTSISSDRGAIRPTANGNISHLKAVTNKLNFFNLMREAGLGNIVPPFWDNRNDITDEDFPIVCRTVLAGHSGDGIVMANDRDQLVQAPLYVKYIKKKDEYRVHCGKKVSADGTESIVTISLQRKARREGYENPNWQVRNHSNGFVFVRGNVNPPASVERVAHAAFQASQLDFGAVDVIYNERQGMSYVLEINTAPGLEGQTVTDYVNFFLGN